MAIISLAKLCFDFVNFANFVEFVTGSSNFVFNLSLVTSKGLVAVEGC